MPERDRFRTLLQTGRREVSVPLSGSSARYIRLFSDTVFGRGARVSALCGRGRISAGIPDPYRQSHPELPWQPPGGQQFGRICPDWAGGLADAAGALSTPDSLGLNRTKSVIGRIEPVAVVNRLVSYGHFSV